MTVSPKLKWNSIDHFYKEYDSDIIMLYVIFQMNLEVEIDVMDERGPSRCDLKTSFGFVGYLIL